MRPIFYACAIWAIIMGPHIAASPDSDLDGKGSLSELTGTPDCRNRGGGGFDRVVYRQSRVRQCGPRGAGTYSAPRIRPGGAAAVCISQPPSADRLRQDCVATFHRGAEDRHACVAKR